MIGRRLDVILVLIAIEGGFGCYDGSRCTLAGFLSFFGVRSHQCWMKERRERSVGYERRMFDIEWTDRRYTFEHLKIVSQSFEEGRSSATRRSLLQSSIALLLRFFGLFDDHGFRRCSSNVISSGDDSRFLWLGPWLSHGRRLRRLRSMPSEETT